MKCYAEIVKVAGSTMRRSGSRCIGIIVEVTLSLYEAEKAETGQLVSHWNCV